MAIEIPQSKIRNYIHAQICKHGEAIWDWFPKKTRELSYPIYSSYDIRDSGYKVSNVDANIYPAGFNNICPTDKETSIGLFQKYLQVHYPHQVKKILLITEEHTKNPYYTENVAAIKDLLEQGGFQVRLAFPTNLIDPLQLESLTGQKLTFGSGFENSNWVKDFSPDLIISNNDFSLALDEWGQQRKIPINPPRELGWYQRKKSRYFKNYNALATEFSDLLQIDPFLLRVETTEYNHFDINSDESRNHLADQVDLFLENLRQNYKRHQIDQEPFCFVKNNAGTYGLGVIRVGSGQEVKDWTYNARKKMKAAKGGRQIEEVIIQEGIPSVVTSEGATAEPVIYMIGCELAGGFLRAHSEKSSTESLNSPGAVYKRLCVTDLADDVVNCPQENVYGWSAKLGLLAIGLEAKEMRVEYEKYAKADCGSI